ncbi:MAG: CsbD family protein [Bdellovibrionia bacterium]
MENKNELPQENLEENKSELPNETPNNSGRETLLERFAKSSAGAKLSGTYNEATGLLKRTLGEFNDDPALTKEGSDQQLLGKVHHIVGDIREIRELTKQKLEVSRDDMQKLLRHHGGKLLDGVASFLDDIKKRLF